MVIWITGISGAGKTTLGKFFIKKHKNFLYFDGDLFRKIFKNDISYTLKDRDINAQRLTRLIKYLSFQNLNIVVAANITSSKYRLWCRKNIKNYIEVFIDADMSNLINRDYKKLYSKALNKKIKNVVGIDIKFKKPSGSHLYISNNTGKKQFLKKIIYIEKYIKKRFKSFKF
tara:strand:+ start:220 stop:735 length:516 start_codon:yes stop_codon:yes gene_type:complete